MKNEKKELMKQISAGLFFIGGITLFCFFVFTIGRDKGLGVHKFPVTVLFRNVGGLSEGAPVRLAGVNVGNVDNINFIEGTEISGRRVAVQLLIVDKYRKQLTQRARYAIKTEGILGEKLIEIDVLDNADTIDLARPIYGDDPLDVEDLAAAFADAAESFTQTSDQLSKINFMELTDSVTVTTKSLLSTSKGINSMMEDLKETTKKSKRVLDRVEQGIIDGNLFKVF